jgi:hypothetical protein
MARLGVPVGGRVRKSRAVKDRSALIPDEIMSGAWNGEGSGQVSFLLVESPR